jgi:hypothetical protein
MIADKKNLKEKNEPMPKDAQQGGQGAVGNEDKAAELDQRAIRAKTLRKTERAWTAAIFVEQINWHQ